MRWAVLGAVLAAGCGKKGGKAVEPVIPPPVVQGVIDTSIKDVAGTLYIGDSSHPAEGYELWRLDHSTGEFRRDILPSTGGFAIQAEDFKQGDVYTFHVLKDFELVADVDMADASDGVQSAFTYEGGPGFAMGPLVLKVDAHGDVDRTATSVQGRIGGGFSAKPESTATFATFPLPKALARLAVGSQLYVFEPATLLHSFYQRAQNPALYAQDLAAFSRVGVRADGSEADLVKKVQVQDAGSWLAAARLASSDVDPPHGGAALWSATSYLTTTSDKRAFGASAYLGSVLSAREVMLLRVQVGDTDPESRIPKILGPIVAVPPLLKTVDLGGGALAAIDYAAAQPNGLTQAFCRTGEVRLGVEGPLDQAGAPIAGLDTVEIVADYYGVGPAGEVKGIEVLATDFPAAWQAAASDKIGDSVRAWEPATRTFKIALGSSDVLISPHVLPFPGGLFLTTVAAGSVAYVRLRVYFKGSKGATEGAMAVWFANACA